MTETADMQEPPAKKTGKGHDSSDLEQFSARLDAVRGARTGKEDTGGVRDKAVGAGFRLASELLAAVIVGLALGLGIDAVADSAPFGLLIGLFIGFATGLRNVAVAMKTGNAADNEGESAQTDQS